MKAFKVTNMQITNNEALTTVSDVKENEYCSQTNQLQTTTLYGNCAIMKQNIQIPLVPLKQLHCVLQHKDFSAANMVKPEIILFINQRNKE